MKKTRLIFLILCTMVLNLVVVGTALATDVTAQGTASQSGISANYGAKTFIVRTIYYGNQYTGTDGRQYVDKHDYYVGVEAPFDWAISRGGAQIGSVSLLNTSGVAVSNIYNSNFSNGSWRGSISDPNSSTVVMVNKYSGSWLQSSGGTYRARATTIYWNNEFGIGNTYEQWYTVYF